MLTVKKLQFAQHNATAATQGVLLFYPYHPVLGEEWSVIYKRYTSEKLGISGALSLLSNLHANF